MEQEAEEKRRAEKARLEQEAEEKRKAEKARLKAEATKELKAKLLAAKQKLQAETNRLKELVANSDSASTTQSGAIKRKHQSIDAGKQSQSTAAEREPPKKVQKEDLVIPEAKDQEEEVAMPDLDGVHRKEAGKSPGKKKPILKVKLAAPKSSMKTGGGKGKKRAHKIERELNDRAVSIGFSKLRSPQIWKRGSEMEVENMQQQCDEFQATVEAQLQKKPGSLNAIAENLMKDFTKGVEFHNLMLETAAKETSGPAYSKLLKLANPIRSMYLTYVAEPALGAMAQKLWDSQRAKQFLSDDVLLTMVRQTQPHEQLTQNLDMWMTLWEAIPAFLRGAHMDKKIQLVF